MAVAHLHAGGVVLHATESVWGLACDPHNRYAVARLLRLKRRSVNQGLLLIGADADAFAPEMALLNQAQRQRILASWPGGHSWLLPNQQFAAWIGGRHLNVGVRVPGHSQARRLCSAFAGPLVSTSANLSGRPAPTNRFQAQSAMGALVDYRLPGETNGAPAPSQITTLDGVRLR